MTNNIPIEKLGKVLEAEVQHAYHPASEDTSYTMSEAMIGAKYSFLLHPAGRTHYHRIGSDDDPVVVLVSGATLPMAVWEPLVAPLVARGFQIIRYDLPGRGHTPLEGLGSNFQAHLDQLHHLLDGLSIHQPVYLVGLASGALVVAAYTVKHRQQVSHVCLIAPDGAATRFTLAERLLSTSFIGSLLFRFSARRTLFARATRYSSRIDIQTFVRKLLDFSLRSTGFYEAALATIRTFPLHYGEVQYKRLAESGVPACIIWGSEDSITPPNAAETMNKLFGEKTLHILENVGHLPFVEEPALIAAILEHHFRGGR